MRRALLIVGFIWILCLSMSLAQTAPDQSQPQTAQTNSEQAEKDKAKAKTEKEIKDAEAKLETTKAKAEKDIEKAKAKLEAAKAKAIKAAMEADKAKLEADEKESKTKAEKSIQEAKGKIEATTAEVEKEIEKAKAEKEAEKAQAEKDNSTKEKASDKAQQKQTDKSAAVKKPKVVCLTLRGDYPEGPPTVDLFSEMRPSLSELIERIDAAAKDKDVAAVWLKFDDLEIGRGKINEIRAAIARLRKANKPIYAELTTATTGQYLVASACDEILMPESGMLIIPGMRIEITFFKGFLDKIGVEIEDLKMGKYKGGLEPLTRRNMSQPLRESLEALIDDTFDEVTSTIAADRKMSDLVVKSLMDHGLFTPEAAKEAGLVDQVIYADQFEDSLRKKLQAEDLDIVSKYKSKTIEADFSGFSGFMKLIELMTGVKSAEISGKKQKIAVVYAVGAIVEGKSSSELFGEKVLGSKTLTAALRKAAENPKVAAIVLRIDSPGGSATASDLIWRETVHSPKPIIASMGDVAGSGGYYIAMGAKKIYAEPGTLTGSIGVLGAKLVLKGLYEKLGLTTEVISRGANNGLLSVTQPFTPEQRRVWTEMLREIYRQFVSKAAQGRNMSVEKLEELAQGRVYTGRMAKKIGLVDEIGTLDDAIAAAKVAAGLKPDADVDLLILPEPKSIFEQLFGDPSSDVETEALTALPKILDIPTQIKTIRQFFS
ncbi:MAG TPA: signal peptide peptidase SppA, partial [Thermoguttaceae bacterium]